MFAGESLRQVSDRFDVASIGVEHEGPIVGKWYLGRKPGCPLSRPPAASAARWKASTVARFGLANATCNGADVGRSEIQKPGFPSLPKPTP